MRGLASGVGLTGAVLVAIVACSGSSAEKLKAAELAEGCVINSDCAGDLVCAFRRCHVQCETSKDCDPGLLCVVSDKPFKVCQLPVEVPCDNFNHSGCPGSQLCAVDNRCREACRSDNDCVPPQVCPDGTCAEPEELVAGQLVPAAPPSPTDPPTPGRPCTHHSNCPDPLVCLFGLCSFECFQDRDCDAPARCTDNVCVGPSGPSTSQPSHCQNGVLDGDESDIDCGGACFPCPPASACTGDADCSSSACSSNVCQTPTCSDARRNGAETGVDCGGPACPACAMAQGCTLPSDCATSVCKNGVCQGVGCDDGLQNGNETAVDCGGGECQPCDATVACLIGGDCTSGVCVGGQCRLAACDDGVQNGGETGVDCGGPCSACAPGLACSAAGDCTSGVCGTDGMCASPTCADSVTNGAETGVDCGGNACGPCADGDPCATDADCLSSSCASNVCGSRHTLTVTLAGTGTGQVSSVPSGILCGGACSADYLDGSTVTLSASAVGSGTFDGWAGAGCSGTGTCAVAMTQAQMVTATFGGAPAGSGIWSKKLGETNARDEAKSSAFDSTGNAFVAGVYHGSFDFGGGPLLGNGNGDVFLVKYSPTGTHLWSRRFGSSSPDSGDGVAISPNGDVFLGARQSALSSLGGAPFTCTTPYSAFARFDGTTASHVWSRCVGPGVRVRAAASDSNGDVIFVGEVSADADFGGGVVIAAGGARAFVAKYAGADGAFRWVMTSSILSGQSSMASVDTDASGDIYVTGNFTTTFDFGAGPAMGAGQQDVLLVKLDGSTGAPIWRNTYGDSAQDEGLAVSVGPDGDPVVTGFFDGAIDFGGGLFNSVGSNDIFVGKYSGADGAHRWSRRYGAAGEDRGVGLGVGPSNEVAITGRIGDGVDFGGGSPLSYVGGTDVFVAKLSASGGHLWSMSFGDTTSDTGNTAAVSPSGNVAIGGYYSGIVDLGTGPLPMSVVDDGFFALLAP